MSISTIRQSNRHRSMPLREAVVWRCKNAIPGAPPRCEIANSRSDTGCLGQLSRVIVSSNDGIFIFSRSVIPQISIGFCPH